MKKLKRCPFCGAMPEFREISKGMNQNNCRYEFFKRYKLWCPNCGCTKRTEIHVPFTYSADFGASIDETELNKAIESWNRRT